MTWLFMVAEMRRRYVSSLLETLRARRLDPAGPIDDGDTLGVLGAALSGSDDLDVLHALELVPSVGRDATRLLRPVVSHRSPEVRLRTLELLARFGVSEDAELSRSRLSDPDPRVRRVAVETHAVLARDSGVADLRSLLADPSLEVRAATIAGLLKHAGAEGRRVAAPALEELIGGSEPETRRLAATVIGELSAPSVDDLAVLARLTRDRT